MKKRVISAVIVLAIIIPLIILGGLWFYIGIGVVGVIGFYEILMIREKKKKFPVVMKLLSMISFVTILLTDNNTFEFIIEYRYLILPLLLLFTPIIFYAKSGKYDAEDALYLIGAVFFLGIAFNVLITIRNLDLYYFLYLMIITITADTFAHFIGTQIGRYKLCPKVSPNKTIEGFIGGTLFATFIGTMFYITMFENSSLLSITFISLLLSVFSSVGDLVFSAIKRHFEIKDFGNIMPGHGGVLDRVDSILFAGLALAMVMSLL